MTRKSVWVWHPGWQTIVFLWTGLAAGLHEESIWAFFIYGSVALFIANCAVVLWYEKIVPEWQELMVQYEDWKDKEARQRVRDLRRRDGDEEHPEEAESVGMTSYHCEAFDDTGARIGGFEVHAMTMGEALAKAVKNTEVAIRPEQHELRVKVLKRNV